MAYLDSDSVEWLEDVIAELQERLFDLALEILRAIEPFIAAVREVCAMVRDGITEAITTIRREWLYQRLRASMVPDAIARFVATRCPTWLLPETGPPDLR